MIKHEDNQWVLFSKDGNKRLGTFDTEKEAKDREKEINAAKHAKAALVDVSLTITKATLQDDGSMHWQAVCSDTNKDRLDERTSLALFQDWIERAETGKSIDFLPSPRMPFLGISHFPDLDGYGEAGPTEKMFIDGQQFKAAGTFFSDNDHPLGRALFDAVRQERELIQRGEGPQQPIRISAAWWDLRHSHGDFVFERKSLDDRCPMCLKGTENKVYLAGQPDHWTATRVPIHPHTSLNLEEKSMATRRQDAESILLEDDQDLAEELETRTKKLTGKSETETDSALVIKTEKSDALAERMFSGATSFADAEAFAEAQDLQDQVWTNFDMFMMVVDNILFAFDEDIDKVAAIEQAVLDFGSRVTALKANLTDAVLFQPIIKAQGDIIMSEKVEKPTPPAVDPSAALKAAIDGALANTALDRAGKEAAAQVAFEAYAETVKAQLDAVAPPNPGEQIAKALTPIVEQLGLIAAKMGVVSQPAAQPQQKSFVPGQPVVNDPGLAALPISPHTGQPSALTKMVRKSVGAPV